MKHRASRKSPEAGLVDQNLPEHGIAVEMTPAQAEKVKEGKDNGSDGYEARPDQTQGLLSGAHTQSRVLWDNDSIDVAEAQRPRSVASFTSAPPRYEEYRTQLTK